MSLKGTGVIACIYTGTVVATGLLFTGAMTALEALFH
jgi:hypothetical protein